MTTFHLHEADQSEDTEARLGRLQLPARKIIETPHYVAVSSRGTVQHITQDMMRSETSIQGIYAGIEDYVEQLPKPPPAGIIPCKPGHSPLRRFIALSDDPLLILGPRRIPPLAPPTPNTYTSINISTSTGFRQLEVNDYIATCTKLRPDIAIGPMDYELGEGRPKPGIRRRDKMAERTLEWCRGLVKANKQDITQVPMHIWAPILPIEPDVQRSYLEYLADEEEGSFAGVALYDTDSITSIPATLSNLPRISFHDLATPQAILHAIDLGIDLCTLPFVTKQSDAGIAFTFAFPIPISTPSSSETPTSKQPLGLNLWSTDYNTSVQPLVPSCPCYACRMHHRAYLRHLLNAKEMLAWTLLQIHNHHMIDVFFARIRRSIAKGTFAQDSAAFDRAYEDEFPVSSGEGPRLRGYQVRIAQAGPPKANEPARRRLEKVDWEAVEAARAAKGRERRDLRRKVDDEAQKIGEADEARLMPADFEFESDLGALDLEKKGLGEAAERSR